MLRVILLAAAVATGASAATAQNRPDTRKMTCAQVQALMAHYKAAVLQTAPHIYGRVVVQGSYCGPQRPWPMSAPTLDNPRCRIGYTCRQSLD